ncbi:MAG: peptidoglycan editing factor PgeF [candidate division WOR-3 bacterium]|nr:peptidoglycan editing factor PgeF [candidate division WOR-3 bacterium]MDW8113417.1 peptidoglycan editing factor PgeF [candidate division WOR-3 bacterium]
MWQKIKIEDLVFYKFNYKKINIYFFTRQGGYSRDNYFSLNLSYEVGDEPILVEKNYQKIKEIVKVKEIITLKQIHSNKIVIFKDEDFDKVGDGIITQKKNILLGIKVADCLPVALFSQNCQIIGIFHIGWRGLYLKICEKIIKLFKNYQEKIYFLLLPSIEQKCYPVDFFIYEKFNKIYEEKFNQKIFLKKNNKYFLDLRKGVREILSKYFLELPGLELCSFCEKEELYSYRRDKITGRNLAGIQIIF